jgi:hypothetical protein
MMHHDYAVEMLARFFLRSDGHSALASLACRRAHRMSGEKSGLAGQAAEAAVLGKIPPNPTSFFLPVWRASLAQKRNTNPFKCRANLQPLLERVGRRPSHLVSHLRAHTPAAFGLPQKPQARIFGSKRGLALDGATLVTSNLD